jgi:hypothetical protein
MPSPFPGMNPYLEHPASWSDFHNAFLISAREALAAQAAPKYVVRIEAHFYQVKVLTGIDRERVNFLEIRGRERELVTVIELLSPANKRSGSDREQFIAKRHRLLSSDVNYVEIDLLRGGPRMPITNLPECEYYALVRRGAERPLMDFWPVRLRDPLPTIPVPLRAPDSDASLDLQAVLHRVYDAARYGSYVYDGDPEPALSPADAAWAQAIASAARRPPA